MGQRQRKSYVLPSQPTESGAFDFGAAAPNSVQRTDRILRAPQHAFDFGAALKTAAEDQGDSSIAKRETPGASSMCPCGVVFSGQYSDAAFCPLCGQRRPPNSRAILEQCPASKPQSEREAASSESLQYQKIQHQLEEINYYVSQKENAEQLQHQLKAQAPMHQASTRTMSKPCAEAQRISTALAPMHQRISSAPAQPPRSGVAERSFGRPGEPRKTWGCFQQQIQDDEQVRVVGLKTVENMKYNERIGTIRGFDRDTGRYKVKIYDSALRKDLLLHMKTENVEALPDPPQQARTMEGSELVSLGDSDAKRQQYDVKVNPQYLYDSATQRVLDATHDFEVLDLPVKPITDMSKLRTAYRRMSLAVHPDKNKHPQAVYAFHKVYGAFETLMDVKQQRQLLDKIGRLNRTFQKQPHVDWDKLAEDDDAEHFQWWWKATVPEIERQVAEFEGQRLDDIGACWISDGVGGDVEKVKWVGLDAAKRLHDAGRAIFLDVRDREDFANAHIISAYCTPLPEIVKWGLVNVFKVADAELVSRIVLNPEMPIIIYSEVATPFARCRAFCRWLLRVGHQTIKPERVRRLRGGLVGWKHKNGPLVRPLRDSASLLRGDSSSLSSLPGEVCPNTYASFRPSSSGVGVSVSPRLVTRDLRLRQSTAPGHFVSDSPVAGQSRTVSRVANEAVAASRRYY